MKIKFLFVFCLAMSAFLSSCNNGDLNVSVKDDDDYYRFTAVFDDNLSPRVSRFLNRQIAPARIDPRKDSKIVTVLPDQTRITLESSPGELMIYLDKDENSPAS